MPPASLLQQFLELRSDETILRFASRFGPLGLVRYRGQELPIPPPLPDRDLRESLTAWRRYQGEFGALLTFAAAIRERRPPPPETFKRYEELGVLPLEMKFGLQPAEKRLNVAAALLESRLRQFIQWCGLRPGPMFTRESAEKPPSGITMIFEAGPANTILGVRKLASPFSFALSLFGALTLQAFAVATGAGFAVCSACGAVFVPRKRQPAFGKRRFCAACGRPAALKFAKAAYRARERESRPKDVGLSARRRGSG
jgi:hypothetical protein